jgi:SAM-dependent methyltransferase
MGYLNPRPNEDSIGQFYAVDYEPYQAPDEERTGWWRRLGRRLRFWSRPDRDSLTALPWQGNGRLLDFGCGSGWYAARMKARGWRVTGMDFSAHAAEQVRRRFGIPVLVGSLPHPQVPAESFDLITMGCVLEHVHQPRRVIEAAAQALRPHGRLVIVVPNLASWGFRFFGQDWWPLELPRHLLHFTPSTLAHLVETCGLRVEQLGMLARSGWMRRSLAIAGRRRKASPAVRFLTRCRRLRLVSSVLTRWSVWAGQADCLLLVARRPA